MKIRTGFVTNSSSTSFGASLGDVFAALLGFTTFSSAWCGSRLGGVGAQGTDADAGGGGGDGSAVDAAILASGAAAQAVADQLAKDAEARNQLVGSLLTSEAAKLDREGQKISAEIEKYTQQWGKAQQGADPSDPGYAGLKKQYDDYVDYLKASLKQVEARKYEIQVAQAEEKIAQESRGAWVKQQQQDLVQVTEQKAFLQAVAKGYGKHSDYDISRVQEQLKQLEGREKELHKTLKANDAEIAYTPRDRGEIGPDPELVRINQQHKQQMAELKQQAAEAQAKRDAQAHAELEKKMQALEHDAQVRAQQAAFWGALTKGAEATQVVSDVSIDILSNVTGPYGKTIKTCYTGLKNVGAGVGEGLAGGDMAKNILKGAVGGLSDIAKDKIGDKFGKSAQQIYTIASEGGKSALDAGLQGKNLQEIVKSGVAGAAKGSLDVATGAITDAILPGNDLPKGLDWSDIKVSTLIKSVKQKNPLTVTHISRDALTEGLKGAAKDQMKNFVKGEDVIFKGWKQGFTDQIIDTGTSLGAPKYTSFVVSATQAVGDAVKKVAAQYD